MQLEPEKIEEFIEKKDYGKLLSYLKEWDASDSPRYLDLYDEWERNMLFYLGKHWIERRVGSSSYESSYIVQDEDEEHFRPVTNYIRRNCNLKRSQILGKKVHSIVKANSENKDDHDSSRLGYLLLKAKHTIDGEDEIQKKAFLHSQVFGISYRSDFKRPLPDQYIEIPEMEKQRDEFFQCEECGNIDGGSSICSQCGNTDMKYVRQDEDRPVIGEDGNPVVNKVILYENAISLPDPFRMKVGPATLKKDIPWIQETSIQSLDWLKRHYQVEAEGYLPENVKGLKKRGKMPRALRLSHEFQIATEKYHSSTDRDVSRSDPEKELDPNSEIHRKLYLTPTSRATRGMLIIWCDSGVIYVGKPDVSNFEKLKRWHPYSTFCYEQHPLRFEGCAYISEQIPINIKINALDAMILEHLDRTAGPDLVEYDNVVHNIDDNGEDGVHRIEPRPELPNGGAPFYLQHPAMSGEVYKMRSDYVAELEKIANVTEVIQGLRPSGVDTYRGLQLLRDSADTAESEVYSGFHGFIRDSSQLKLAILQECLKTNSPDLVEMMETIRLNENIGINQVKYFTGADLRNNLNIVIEEIDYAGQSKAAEVDRVSGLLEAKILSPQDLDDPITKHTLLRRFGLGTVSTKDSADIELTERMIQYLDRGEFQLVIPMLKPYNNPMIMMRMLTDWMKSAKYETADPQIKMFAEEKILKPLREALMMRQQPPPPPQGAGVGGPPLPPPGVKPPGP